MNEANETLAMPSHTLASIKKFATSTLNGVSILSLFPSLSTHRIDNQCLGEGFENEVCSSIPTSSFVKLLDAVTYWKNPQSISYFSHEALIAAIAVSFCRYTVRSKNESQTSRLMFAILLGYLAFCRFDYWILMICQALTYCQSVHSFFLKKSHVTKEKTANEIKWASPSSVMATILVYLMVSYALFSTMQPIDEKYNFFQSFLYVNILKPRILSSDICTSFFNKCLNIVSYLVPLPEFQSAYNTLAQFVDKEVLHTQMAQLFYVTFNIQVGMGFLGISFLRREQERKNALIRLEGKETGGKKNVEKKEEAAKIFRRDASKFILSAALPYMFQLIFYGGTNMYAFHCFRDDVHRSVRLSGLFDGDSGTRFVATATVPGSKYRSPGSYASNIETVVSTVYNMINSKCFSIPKLVLVPAMIARQPILLVKIFPLVMLSDYIKSSVVATLNSEIERLSKKEKDLESTRTRVEQFDLKNSELIQRSGYGSIAFTERRWVDLTEEIQDINIRHSLMKRARMYFSFLQRSFVMMALVDCALAGLIVVGRVASAEIFVYQRAIEDTIDLILMRSRAESELASMDTSINLLKDLKETWESSQHGRKLSCEIAGNETGVGKNNLNIQNLAYSRGSAYVKIDEMSIEPGIYALTGANGSGKSTFFRLVMSCDTNKKSIDLSPSIILEEGKDVGQPVTFQMPSDDVIEISQTFYWPLFTKPVDWIYQTHLTVDVQDEIERNHMVTRIIDELQSMKFYGDMQQTKRNTPDDEENPVETTSAIDLLRKDLNEVKEDWFSDLSGGQKSKVELVRKVFLHEKCPKVLLIDETFAPLDPESKSLVMEKLKQFCLGSVIIVIYHTDVEVSESDDDAELKDEINELSAETDDNICVKSANFFDKNIHVQDGSIYIRPVCSESMATST